MQELFLNIDLQIFYFFNQTLANPVFDIIMPFITNFKHWVPVYIIFIILGLWKGGAKGRIAVLAVIVAVGLNDYLSSSVLKEIFERLRPCRELADVRLLISCGPGFSFPSSHSSNSFTMAALLAFFYPKRQWIFWILAAMIAFSRTYCGVHYPGDILAGAIFGLLVAFVFQIIIKYTVPKRFLPESKLNQISRP